MTSDSEELIDCENCPHNSSWHTGENFSVTPDSTKCSANNCKCSKFLAPKAQSEAPSVDTILRELVRQAELAGSGNIYASDSLSLYLSDAVAKINRLIIEAELRGFDKAFDSHDYDGLREYRAALSNNLSKEQLGEK